MNKISFKFTVETVLLVRQIARRERSLEVIVVVTIITDKIC